MKCSSCFGQQKLLGYCLAFDLFCNSFLSVSDLPIIKKIYPVYSNSQVNTGVNSTFYFFFIFIPVGGLVIKLHVTCNLQLTHLVVTANDHVFCVWEKKLASGTKRLWIPYPHIIFKLTKKTPMYLMAGSKPITACLKCYQWEKFFRDSKRSEPWWYSSPLLFFPQNPRQNTQ